MAIEQLRADTLSDSRAEIVYVLTDQASTVAAKSLLLSTAPSTFNSLPRQTRQFTVTEEEDEGGVYLGRAVYGTGGGQMADMAVGDTRIIINTVGGTTHISHSLSTEHTYGDAEDYGGAIGVDSEGTPQGTDIFTGGLDITIVKIVDAGDLDTAYLSTLLGLTTPTPTTNAGTFSHTDSDGREVQLAAGEGLFLGFSNSPRGNGEDEVRYQFKGSKNLTDAVPAAFANIAKDGWEHVWLHYAPEVDAVADLLVHKANSAYVEKVYPSGDWGDIDL